MVSIKMHLLVDFVVNNFIMFCVLSGRHQIFLAFRQKLVDAPNLKLLLLCFLLQASRLRLLLDQLLGNLIRRTHLLEHGSLVGRLLLRCRHLHLHRLGGTEPALRVRCTLALLFRLLWGLFLLLAH